MTGENRGFRRVVIVGDGHSGHRAGLTPPQWWGNINFIPGTDTPYDKWAQVRRQLWLAFSKKIDELRPIDVLIYDGDAIDGPGKKSGGSELIEIDPQIQCEIAIETIKFINPQKTVMVYGTPYHTGNNTDYENIIAKDVRAEEISSQAWPEINGLVFDVKHFISGTSVPYGKGTRIEKDRVWNILHHEFEESQPKADIVIRAHVHDFYHCGGPNWLGMTIPSLQGLGSKYGARKPSGVVHFGFVWFDIIDRYNWKWEKWILTGMVQKKTALTL